MGKRAESIDFEKKRLFQGNKREKLELVKNIVAMANTNGGKIIINKLEGIPADAMDSAKLDDLVNKFVEPRIENIESSVDKKGKVTIRVEASSRRPHVFIHEASYEGSKGRFKSAFHPGQVYVRHSSKTEPATADDLHFMIRSAVSSWIGQLANSLKELSLEIGGKGGIPVYPSDEPSALQISIKDVNEDYPYTTKTLGVALGKSTNWVAKAAQKLGLKEDKLYCCPIKGAAGKIVIYKYSEEAKSRLIKVLKEDPGFNPYEKP
jgi:hypothetical protein